MICDCRFVCVAILFFDSCEFTATDRFYVFSMFLLAFPIIFACFGDIPSSNVALWFLSGYWWFASGLPSGFHMANSSGSHICIPYDWHMGSDIWTAYAFYMSFPICRSCAMHCIWNLDELGTRVQAQIRTIWQNHIEGILASYDFDVRFVGLILRLLSAFNVVLSLIQVLYEGLCTKMYVHMLRSCESN